jgi:hypothetical protein
MIPTMPEITFAVVMVAVNVAIYMWFRKSEAAGSARRMMNMITRAGVDRRIVSSDDPHTGAVMKAAWRQCRRCPREDLCERWLRGEVDGANAFCPNAGTFRALA